MAESRANSNKLGVTPWERRTPRSDCRRGTPPCRRYGSRKVTLGNAGRIEKARATTRHGARVSGERPTQIPAARSAISVPSVGQTTTQGDLSPKAVQGKPRAKLRSRILFGIKAPLRCKHLARAAQAEELGNARVTPLFPRVQMAVKVSGNERCLERYLLERGPVGVQLLHCGLRGPAAPVPAIGPNCPAGSLFSLPGASGVRTSAGASLKSAVSAPEVIL